MKKDIKFEKKVIKPVVKAAKKYKKKHHTTLDKSNIGHLKIQTANIFVRIVSGIIGLSLLVGGVFLFVEESFIFSFVLFLIGVILIVLGIRGRKRELQSVLDTIDIVDGIEMIIDVITEIDL